MTADILVIAAYFCAIFGIGLYAGRKQDSLESYALGNRSLPWWAILASIIAAEISAASFLGTPGEGFVLRNYTYVQLGIGTLLGRIIVGKLFLKPYYQYRVVSIYEYLEKRFGMATRRFASFVFLVSRVLASGTRLFFAGILLVIAYTFLTGSEHATEGETVVIYLAALTFITIVTAIYTTLGGLKAVVWTDVLQASILAVSVVTTIIFLLLGIMGEGSLADAWQSICATISDTSLNPCGHEPLQPWDVVDTGISATRSWAEDLRYILGSEYTLWSAFLGATFITMATMGTDQDMVQRMLAARDSRTGSRAVILSGVLDMPIVLIFLSCGMLVFVYFQKHGITPPEKAIEIFPYFIIHYLPAGLRGLLVAALLATAMGSLSTALNALATTATRDWYRSVFRPQASDRELLRAARWFTVGFSALLILVGSVTAWYSVKDPSIRILPIALGIFGYTYGSLLGVFLLGMLTRRRGSDCGNIIAMVSGFVAVITLELLCRRGVIPPIAFPWRVTIGTIVTMGVGLLFPTPQRDSAA
ncbi:MAG: sodium:solute symporter [Akkermansiaceae bacterium]|nr:sodium:solute symporter [Akkermansiaceae bacterium]